MPSQNIRTLASVSRPFHSLLVFLCICSSRMSINSFLCWTLSALVWNLGSEGKCCRSKCEQKSLNWPSFPQPGFWRNLLENHSDLYCSKFNLFCSAGPTTNSEFHFYELFSQSKKMNIKTRLVLIILIGWKTVNQNS